MLGNKKGKKVRISKSLRTTPYCINFEKEVKQSAKQCELRRSCKFRVYYSSVSQEYESEKMH